MVRYRRRRYRRRRIGRRRRRRSFARGKNQMVRTMPSKYGNSLLPPITRVKMIFADQYKTMQGAPWFTYLYRGNSIYDPDVELGGTTVLGHTQWAAFYQRYRVLSSKIIVRYAPRNAQDAGHSVQCTVLPTTDVSNPPATPQAFQMAAYSRTAQRNLYDGRNRLTKYMSTSMIYGIPKIGVRVDDHFSTNMYNNPTKEWFWYVSLSTTNTNTLNLDMQVTIVYYVELYDRTTLASAAAVNDEGDQSMVLGAGSLGNITYPSPMVGVIAGEYGMTGVPYVDLTAND